MVDDTKKPSEYRNGAVEISGRAPSKVVMWALTMVAGGLGVSGGTLLPIWDTVPAEAYYAAKYNARQAERRNTEWESCWPVEGVQRLDDAGCPPAYFVPSAVARGER